MATRKVRRPVPKPQGMGPYGVFFIGLIVVTLVVSVIAVLASPKSPEVTDPKKDTVRVSDYVSKVCDGPNLVYDTANGGAVSPNDPQCK